MAWRGVRACFAYLLAALIVLSQVNITAFAAEGIEYFEGSTRNTKPAGDVTTIIASTIAWRGDSGEEWYATDGDVMITQEVNVSGDVRLILKDGSTLTINGGIKLAGDNASLKIYGQRNGTGKLMLSTAINNRAGIEVSTGKSLTIYGGKIEAKGGFCAAGIGGRDTVEGGTIMIHGGDITAKGGDFAAGIGGGADANAGNITISGGDITAIGGKQAAGIGGGAFTTVAASGAGTITISGGNITAKGGGYAAGIGGGHNGNTGTITIHGGDITAKAGERGAGIGGGYKGNAGTIKIHDGNITATGGVYAPGIGGGADAANVTANANGGTITIQGGDITATGGEQAAGIGKGVNGANETFTTGTNGSAVIYTNSISDKSNERNWSGVIFEGNTGKVYGSSVTPNTDFEIPSGKTLAIETGKTLEIATGKNLTNNGTINIKPGATLTNNGILENKPGANINIEQNGTITNNGTLTNDGTITNEGKIIKNGTINGSSQIGGLVGVPSQITSQPQSQTVTEGDSVEFTVEVTGTSAPTYKWQVKTASADWQDINDATSNTYRIGSVSFAMNDNKYRCQVTNTLGTVTSSEVTLTVNKINGGGSDSGYISGSVGDSSGGSSDSSGTKSNNDKQNMENTGLLPLKVDANGNVTITKDIILKAIKKAKAEAKNGKETIAKIAIETGAAPKSVKISIKSDALKELISSNIHRFVIDTDRFIDLGFNAKTLKKLKSKTKGDVIFSISKTKVTSSGAKKAIGKRPVYDISIAYSKNGQETKIENLNGKTVSISIPYKASKKEEAGKLYAVYVDKQGKVEWLTKSSYDKDKKAVVFETAHFSIYGVGYKKDITKFKDIT